MRKIKIYLAKSNLCSLELAARVRSYLSSINNVEVVEFTGGEYSHTPLKECDILIVVPPKDGEETSTITTMGHPLKGIFVGRGLFEQMKEFSRKGASRARRFFVREEKKSGTYHFVLIVGSGLCGDAQTNWTDHWGVLWTDDRITDMDKVVAIHSGIRPTGVEGTTGLVCDIGGDSSELDLKLLLIKRRGKQT